MCDFNDCCCVNLLWQTIHENCGSLPHSYFTCLNSPLLYLYPRPQPGLSQTKGRHSFSEHNDNDKSKKQLLTIIGKHI